MHKTIASFRLAAFAGLIAGCVLPAGVASAQEGVFMRDLLGQLGIIPAEKDPIIYRERPPLVVPPSPTLPAPAPVAAERSAAWPKDPDVLEQERQAAARRAPQRSAPNSDPSQGGRLSVDNIRSGRTLTSERVRGTDEGTDEMRRRSGWVSFNDLRPNPQSTEAAQALAYGEEPDRRYLSDPPSGLRRPAGTARLDSGARDAARPWRESTGQREFITGTENLPQ